MASRNSAIYSVRVLVALSIFLTAVGVKANDLDDLLACYSRAKNSDESAPMLYHVTMSSQKNGAPLANAEFTFTATQMRSDTDQGVIPFQGVIPLKITPSLLSVSRTGDPVTDVLHPKPRLMFISQSQVQFQTEDSGGVPTTMPLSDVTHQQEMAMSDMAGLLDVRFAADSDGPTPGAAKDGLPVRIVSPVGHIAFGAGRIKRENGNFVILCGDRTADATQPSGGAAPTLKFGGARATCYVGTFIVDGTTGSVSHVELTQKIVSGMANYEVRLVLDEVNKGSK